MLPIDHCGGEANGRKTWIQDFSANPIVELPGFHFCGDGIPFGRDLYSWICFCWK